MGLSADIKRICSFDKPPYPLRAHDGNLRALKTRYEDALSRVETITGILHSDHVIDIIEMMHFFHTHTAHMKTEARGTEPNMVAWADGLEKLYHHMFNQTWPEMPRNYILWSAYYRRALRSRADCLPPSTGIESANICWSPFPSETIRNLSTTRCADQR